ncbi:hypothetical protein HNQ91_000620 [Filimonas zeae]|uniref:Uncharacterized protein n=1 Tax=Filimonas zeae TaxID=1737353 RepID=A0A917MRR6_9BACT|nr:hypothetical protein [Filimonas zeae]MDR6337598.1 hypothetical protein [Filimonas zeae]GGH59386.1 hypothetical protein GCM10011379_06100 [Filimonas zeae]
MNATIQYTKKGIWVLLLLLSITACNKENLNQQKAMQIVINGYNGSDNALQVLVDTTAYGLWVSNGKHLIKPASVFEFNIVYTYPVNQPPQRVMLLDTITQKIVFSQALPIAGTKAIFNYLYVGGKELAVPAPATGTAANPLGFYISYTDNDEPFDISLYRIDNNSGQEYRTWLAKNVKPNTWIQIDYTADTAFDSNNELSNASICFTKPGTTDQWAFRDNESSSKRSVGGMGFPKAGETGVTLSWFLKPGDWTLETSRLFFHPDRN